MGDNQKIKTMPYIFISYRRADSRQIAQRISDHLNMAFGADHVFIDVQDIRVGKDFRLEVQKAIQHANVMLVILGPLWEGPRSLPFQKPRLFDADDVVRAEIRMALERKIEIIPVLVNGRNSLSVSHLPEDLKSLPYLNFSKVRDDADYASDIRNLTEHLRSLDDEPTLRPGDLLLVPTTNHILPAVPSANGRNRRTMWIAALIVVLLLTVGALALLASGGLGAAETSESTLIGINPTDLPAPTASETPVTPTDTVTEAPTNTPTATLTRTLTATPTPSATMTATPTRTATDTPTNTASPTVTNTPTPTRTYTVTPSATMTSTPTSTPTDTLTNTPSPTVTRTPTSTATHTPSNTPSPTVTNTLTPTPTVTPILRASSTELETITLTIGSQGGRLFSGPGDVGFTAIRRVGEGESFEVVGRYEWGTGLTQRWYLVWDANQWGWVRADRGALSTANTDVPLMPVPSLSDDPIITELQLALAPDAAATYTFFMATRFDWSLRLSPLNAWPDAASGCQLRLRLESATGVGEDSNWVIDSRVDDVELTTGWRSSEEFYLDIGRLYRLEVRQVGETCQQPEDLRLQLRLLKQS